jgi:hypothetical protein
MKFRKQVFHFSAAQQEAGHRQGRIHRDWWLGCLGGKMKLQLLVADLDTNLICFRDFGSDRSKQKYPLYLLSASKISLHSHELRP